jgi:hypothetical protein
MADPGTVDPEMRSFQCEAKRQSDACGKDSDLVATYAGIEVAIRPDLGTSERGYDL